MRRVLGRKQNLTPDGEALWWQVWDNIGDYCSEAECAEWTRKARQRLIDATDGKRAGYTWSGGKDSLVLADLCRSVGITKSQAFITDLEFPSWRRWVEENMPEGCEAVYIGYDIDFIAEHPEMLFCRGEEMQKWHRLVQRRNIVKFARDENLDVVCIGHRTIDGNFCGKGGVVRRKTGETILAPIYDWPHEVILAYLRYHGIELPFIYRWPKGFRNGTHFWPTRKVGSVEQGYREVYEIDPSVVIEAAEKIPSAREWLERNV